MAAISDLSDLVNRCTGGNSGSPENIFCCKVGRIAGSAATTPGAGRMVSLWLYDGIPAAGVAPTSGAIPTNATNGALKQTNPGGGREKWLVSLCMSRNFQNNSGGFLILYDRLFHIGGLSGTSTSDQSVQGASPSPALTRNTGGVGNAIVVEIYTQIGNNERTLTVTYTNQAGTTGKTATLPLGGSNFNIASRAAIVPLAAGDTGVQAVEKVALNTSTGTAGNFGISIVRPLATVPIGDGGLAGFRDFTIGLPGIPKIDTDACLSWLWIPQGNHQPELVGLVSMIEA